MTKGLYTPDSIPEPKTGWIADCLGELESQPWEQMTTPGKAAQMREIIANARKELHRLNESDSLYRHQCSVAENIRDYRSMSREVLAKGGWTQQEDGRWTPPK